MTAKGEKAAALRAAGSDPSWIILKHERSKCLKCGKSLLKGEYPFHYPLTETVLCGADHCGGQACRDFEAAQDNQDLNHKGVKA
jgi:hypothetical protein